MLNKTFLMGRLVADPELRKTLSGISVCSFAIAVDRPYSREREQQTDFIDIVAWRQTAEFVSRYFSKGKMIIIEGSIQTRSYEDKNGNKRKAVEILADNVQFGEAKSASASAGASAPSPAYTAGPAQPVRGFSEMTDDSEDLPF